MANELRVRSNFLGGAVEDNPLASGATTLTSAALQVAPAVGATQHMPITLDPDGFDGPPEIAWITAHAAGANTATLLRGQEGTAARLCYQDTPWVHGPTILDVPTDSDRWVTYNQFALTGGGIRKYDGTYISWSQRFIAISTGNGLHASTAGYVDINFPAVGVVIPGYFGAVSQTVAAAGLPLPVWQALWYEVTPGMGNAVDNTKFRITNYNTGPIIIPRNWVLVAIQNGDEGYVKWGSGHITDQWRTATLLNSWTSYDAGAPQYRKLSDGRVMLRGAIAGGTSNPNPMFNLPAGYRPSGGPGANDQRFPVLANGLLGWVSVFANGDVRLISGSNTWVDLASIQFYAEV